MNVLPYKPWNIKDISIKAIVPLITTDHIAQIQLDQWQHSRSPRCSAMLNDALETESHTTQTGHKFQTEKHKHRFGFSVQGLGTYFVHIRLEGMDSVINWDFFVVPSYSDTISPCSVLKRHVVQKRSQEQGHTPSQLDASSRTSWLASWAAVTLLTWPAVMFRLNACPVCMLRGAGRGAGRQTENWTEGPWRRFL